MVDFVVWNRCALEKIAKKRDKLCADEAPIRGRISEVLRERDAWTGASSRALGRDLQAACGRGGEGARPRFESGRLRGGRSPGGRAGSDASIARRSDASPSPAGELLRLGTARGEEAPPEGGVLAERLAAAAAAAAGEPPPEPRVVFLAVDGVLHPVDARDKETLDPACVEALAHVVRATRARLVLAGPWRLYPDTRRRVEALLRDRGLPPLLGATPELTSGRRSSEREIRGYFARRPADEPRPRWIALDAGRLDGLRGHLVRTDGERGLSALDAHIAVGLLRNDARARDGIRPPWSRRQVPRGSVL